MNIQDLRNPPPTQFDMKAAMRLFDTRGQDQISRDRMGLIALSMTLVVLTLGAALFMLTPLKTVVPYVIETDQSGATQAVAPASTTFTPTEAQVRHELYTFVEYIWSLDAALLEHNLQHAYGRTRGKAIDVFKEFVQTRAPFERWREDNSLSIQAQVTALNFVSKNAAIMRVAVTERRRNSQPVTEHYQMVLHFSIVPPASEEDIRKNPIGFFVTDFNWSRDRGAAS